MQDAVYSEAVGRLLRIGSIPPNKRWLDYQCKFGIQPADTDELLRMAESPELNEGDPDSKDVWGPVHALRALGQLRAASAVPRMIRLIDEYPDDDWLRDDLPNVFADIGPDAVPALREALAGSHKSRRTRTAASEGLAKTGVRYPECYPDAVAAIVSVLERMERSQSVLNGHLICGLLELGATETVPLLERVFRENRVDHGIVGWECVQKELGITAPDPSPEHFIDSRPDPQKWYIPFWPGVFIGKPGGDRDAQNERRQARKRQRKAKVKARRAAKRKR